MIRDCTNGFFASRWHSQVDLGVLFWRDMIVVGTLINLVSGFAALILFTQNAAAALALSVHFAPLPYNAFLVGSVWRSTQCTPLASLVAGAWFVGMMVI